MVGDSNGDGIQDSSQPSVASTPFLITPTAVSNPAGALPTYVSLIADSLGGTVDPDANTAQITSLTQIDAPANVPAILNMPLGVLAFTATVGLSDVTGTPGTPQAPGVGITETFSLYVDPSMGANGFWVQNASGVWCNLASAAYGGTVVLEGGKLRLDFQLVDGGEFDTDGLVNGNVSNVGAAANMPLSLVGYAPTSPTTGDFFF